MPKVLINYCVEKEFDVVMYVDPVNGLDTNDGLTQETAVKTFDKAVELNKENTSLISACVFLSDTTIVYKNCNFNYMIGTDMCKIILTPFYPGTAQETTALAFANSTFVCCTVDCQSFVKNYAFAYGYYKVPTFTVNFDCCRVIIRCTHISKNDSWGTTNMNFYNCCVWVSVNSSGSYNANGNIKGTKCVYEYQSNGKTFLNLIGAVDINTVGEYSKDYGLYSSEYYNLFTLNLPEVIKSDYLDKIRIDINNSDVYVSSLNLKRIDMNDLVFDCEVDFSQFPCFYKDIDLSKLTDYTYSLTAQVIVNKDYFTQGSLITKYYQRTSEGLDRYMYKEEFKIYLKDGSAINDSYYYRLLTDYTGITSFGKCLPSIIVEKNTSYLLGGIEIYGAKNDARTMSGFKVYVSKDGVNWNLVFTEPDGSTRMYTNGLIDCKFESNYKVRFVMIKVTSLYNSQNELTVGRLKLYSYLED